jgi:hypothetical protein
VLLWVVELSLLADEEALFELAWSVQPGSDASAARAG